MTHTHNVHICIYIHGYTYTYIHGFANSSLCNLTVSVGMNMYKHHTLMGRLLTYMYIYSTCIMSTCMLCTYIYLYDTRYASECSELIASRLTVCCSKLVQ